MSVKNHYNNVLGEIYPWMAGDFESEIILFSELLNAYKIVPQDNGVALDLRAGHGIQNVNRLLFTIRTDHHLVIFN